MDDSNGSQNEDHKVMSPPNFFNVNFGSLTLHPWALADLVLERSGTTGAEDPAALLSCI